MELKYIGWSNRNILAALMNRIQHISVANNFIFIAIPWSGPFFKKLFHPRTGRNNSLYTSGIPMVRGSISSFGFFYIISDDMNGILDEMVCFYETPLVRP
ncbi:hypothetical protein [Hornefia butyriciproducens]|uniref:hypothetical protein n=1 Tax=Hornefia butyriciproducens TaxID=2652293 RepID=UPI0023F14A9F|nr:hypothetical protein [Hornefia butyriciproducens]MDD6299724.1 hypothetical protein [Hornefia butyriciproducens]